MKYATESKTKAIVAPKIINNINQKDVVKAATLSPEFK